VSALIRNSRGFRGDGAPVLRPCPSSPRVADVPGAEAVFRGTPIPTGPMAGRSPVLAVLKDGRVVKGFDKPHPFGKPYNIIDLKDLR
jgi:hypothetical protein